MIRVLVVDDHDLVRMGLVRMLDDIRGIKVVGEASSGEEAVSLARELDPTVVLMDVQMPGIGGLEAIRKILRYDDSIRLIAITAHDDGPIPAQVLKAGATGFLGKGASIEEVVLAIRKVASGQRYIAPEVAQQIAFQKVLSDGSPFEQLSEREHQIMMMVINCEKVQDISDRLSISPKTVNTYRYRIFNKLGITSDVELVLLAVKHGLVSSS